MLATRDAMAILGLVRKRSAPRAHEVAVRVVEWARDAKVAVLAEPDCAADLGVASATKLEMFARADAIAVLGGDGTFLATARLAGAREVPVLGVNLGGLGFLTEIMESEIEASLAAVLGGTALVERRGMLRATVRRVDGLEDSFQAFNDAVLSRGSLGRTVDIEVRIEGSLLGRFSADGLIVSTPTGSTAYNLSAGGPAIHPSVRVHILAAICPHTLSVRPVVVDDSARLEFRLGPPREELLLTLDGQETVRLGPDDAVLVTRCEYQVLMVRSPRHDFYDLLRTKLGWGRS